jgi:hypothetical protein
MVYALQISGLVAPLSIASTPLLPGTRGRSYSQQLTAANGIGAVSWNVQSGSLPPGLTLDLSGAIGGTPTTNGMFSFSVNATDAGTPPQTVDAQEQIQIVDPVKITSAAIWPDACLNQPYTFAVTKTGGLQPFQWGFVSTTIWPGFEFNQSTGVFSGSAPITGTFKGTVGVIDASFNGDSQNM